MKYVLPIALVFTLLSCGSDDTVDTPINGMDASADAQSDLGAEDARDDDATVEDSGTADMGAQDMAQQDMAQQDMAQEDMAQEDMGEADSGDPDMASGGCATGFTQTAGIDESIVACAGPDESLNQCDSADACATGWHVCTASEYRARYEAVEPAAASTGTFWLAGCVRDGAAPTSPSDQVCSDCTGVPTGSDEDVAFSCINSIRASSESLHVGVRAGSACVFVGTDDAGNDAYWNATPAASTLNGAFCCAD